MKTVKIYLGDLTYNTVGMSTEVFPLNIGYIAAYCISRFGQAVDITLFKYIDELDSAINESPPTILGMSNYAWNHQIALEMFRMLSQRNPYALRVWGGPNFPADVESQRKFMNQYHEVDVYVPIEGEVGFANIVERVLEVDSEEKIREKVLTKPIDGCISRGLNRELQYSNPVLRINDLDEIPSPYLTGLSDKFFDGKLTPMIQTNRGCPFSCSFCVDGSDSVKQVNRFSVERVRAELDYIGSHVPKNIHSMHISDLNFGMFPRDIEVCDAIVEIQQKYGYPRRVMSTTGKNKKERIIQAIKRLNGTMSLTMSVQSMDEQVLSNIRRANISVDHMLALMPAIREADLVTESEVILGLPGETYESHVNTLRKLVRAQLDFIQVYTCMLLNGSELNTPEQRKKWGFKSKFRILPRDFATISNGKKVIEVEEVVVGSNTLTFDEYVDLRLLAFAIWVTNIGIIYDPLLKLLRERNMDVFELFFRTMKQVNNAHINIQKVFNSYRKATVDELWDSSEEIQIHYQDDKEYQKLLNGEAAMNVIQYHNALVRAEYMDDWTEYILGIAYDLLKETRQLDEELEQQFLDVGNYCRGLGHNTMGNDRMLTNPEFTFRYDIKRWLDDTNNSSLKSYKLSSPQRVAFQFSEDQYHVVQDELERCNNHISRSQALKRIPLQMQWRNPVNTSSE
ncbi:MAG: B12-binding domain-containing radical SAM protein [Nitrosopumilaceae archaeon]